jgi:hypothetical protein
VSLRIRMNTGFAGYTDDRRARYDPEMHVNFVIYCTVSTGSGAVGSGTARVITWKCGTSLASMA